jgi:hypothetical protein
MASGHGYRANRPNTWPLRPSLQSEDSSCQPGAVHTWPLLRPPSTSAFAPLLGDKRTSASTNPSALIYDEYTAWIPRERALSYCAGTPPTCRGHPA